MKKILSSSLLFSILFTAFLVAVPHTHEGDWNHANHQTCPIYQASLQEWSSAAASLFFSAAPILIQTLVPWRPDCFDFQPLSLPLIRGPPTLI